MLAGLTRTNISAIFRKILVALITISVHARDTIENMVAKRVHNRLSINLYIANLSNYFL